MKNEDDTDGCAIRLGLWVLLIGLPSLFNFGLLPTETIIIVDIITLILFLCL